MLSNMSYTPVEVFTTALKSRLQNLTTSTEDQYSLDSKALLNMPQDTKDFLKNLRDDCHSTMLVRTGTTFPPSRWAHFDLARVKYHSETDLTTSEGKVEDLSSAKEVDLQHNLNEDVADGYEDAKDSDLFFDFDIDLRDPEELLESHIESSQESTSPPDLETVKPRRTSESSSISIGSSTMTEPSTAFGSTSSGLFSDVEMKAVNMEEDDEAEADEMLEGLSLDPEDWLKNPGASFKEIMSMKKSEGTPTVSLSPLGSSTKNDDSSNSDSKDSEDTMDGHDGRTMKICIGDKEKHVAHSKLTALISLLEKDRGDQSGPNTRSSTIKTPSKSPSPQIEILTHKPTHMGTSPANFNFLTGGVSKSVTTDSTTTAFSSFLERSHSTSVLNDIHKSHSEAAVMPYLGTSIISPRNGVKEGSSEQPRSEEDNKAKYRRCSSLKSGKTPPGTPGQRKIVR
jgi:hypothetical protein